MKFFETRINIAATPETVWQVLTDTSRLATGRFGIKSLTGNLRLGGKLTLVTHASPRSFKLKVTSFTPEKEMVWQGGMPLGLFKGVRRYTLKAAEGGTAFHMREEFTGLMLPLIWKSMPDLTPDFGQFAQALKHIAEEIK